MICSSCGNGLAPDVRFCPRCGAPAAVPAPPQGGPVHTYMGVPPVLPYSRVGRHLQIAGILWLVYAVERTAGKIIGMMFLRGFLGSRFRAGWGTTWGDWGSFGFAALWPIMITSLIVGLILALLTGYALLTKQPWGRVLAIVASVLALFHPITGTAIGIYTLWVLAPAASGVEYAAITAQTSRP